MRTTTEEILSLSPLLPIWAIVAVAAAMAYLLYDQVRGLKERLPGSRLPLILSLLRLSTYAVILLITLNPVVQQLKYLIFQPHVAVLVDGSVSMSVDDGGVSRLDKVKTLLKGDAWQRLTSDMKDYIFDYYSFGSRLENIDLQEALALKARQDETNLFPALAELAGRYKEVPLAGAVIFSDGKDRSALKGGAIEAPVIAVGAGTGSYFKDIRISSLKAPDFSFLHKPVNIELEVSSAGYSEIELPVVLKKNGKIVSTDTITLTQGEGSKQLFFSFVPDQLDQQEISVEVVPQPDEAVVENNRVNLVLPVERDKIRILMISGRPSWNYRFMRHALKSDGSIDLISFIILRSPTDPVNVPQNQLSLIPFPAEELFVEELDAFDLIIFDNFSLRLNLPAQYMANVAEAVANGVAFMMTGGDESFYQGGYDGTPIEEILPVVLDPRSTGYLQEKFPFRLTEQGAKHPVMRILGEADPSAAWADLPPLSGFNGTLRAKPDAIVLGINGHYQSELGPMPVVALMKFGEGRTAAILSDGLWRWNFQSMGKEKSNRPYLSMLRQLIRWLVKDPSLDQVNLSGKVIQKGNEGRILMRTRVYHDDFSPAPDASLNINAIHPSGKTHRLDYLPGNLPGEYTAEMEATEDGIYAFTVEAFSQGKLIGRGEIKIQYAPLKTELDDAAPDEALLRSLAETTGGKYFRPDEFSSSASAQIASMLKTEPLRKLMERKVEPLLKKIYMLVLLTSLPAMEWFLRRRGGLI